MCCICCVIPAWAMTVTFLNPGKSDEIYWVNATQSMEAAARSLGIQLEVLYAERNHLQVLTFARQLAARPRFARPDYVILSNDYATGPELIRILDAAHIKTFLSFSGISDQNERARMGAPRSLYRGWLGGLEPQSEDAGYLTAQALIAKARAARLTAPDGKLHMLVIAGDRSTTSSLKRNTGMHRAVGETADVIIDQEVYAEWNRAKAQEQSQWLYLRYPHARLVWSGNDLMAFGAMEAWRAKGGKPGSDALFSAINTSAEAFTALESGSLTALAGGHFVTGAFSLVMLYDYHNGKDFADEGMELTKSMFILFPKEELSRFRFMFGDINFAKMNFRKFSKVLNPSVKKYHFSLSQLMTRTGERK
ncbi:ABC transporter substrate-binding protein [Undibacterium sp. CY7W]|uniref:ABC transporter substrate-binding protein n=2 Tax=Undibacterium rugosum TaxID=2762291 RepID=A0A923I0X5_9BURK|nr:ABC transporter substrate-binding protein [Undibacterium rugosum]